MNTIKIFVTSFPSLTLHAVNLLLWKKIPSLTPFKIITVKGPGTLTRVFLMGRSGCPTMGGNWVGDFPARPKIWTFPFCWISPPLKSQVLCPSSDDRPHIEKKISLIKQIVTKNLPVVCIFSYTILTYLKKLEPSPLMQNSLQQDYLPEKYRRYLLSYQKFPSFDVVLLHPPYVDFPPFPEPLWETLGMDENPTQQPKIFSFLTAESPSIDLHLLLSKVSFVPYQIVIFM